MCVTLEAKLTTKVCQFYVKNLSRAQTRIIETRRRVCACKHKYWFPGWWETSGALGMASPHKIPQQVFLHALGVRS